MMNICMYVVSVLGRSRMTKKLVKLKNGTQHWYIEAICSDCHTTFTYTTPFKHGNRVRTRKYCDTCISKRQRESDARYNESRVAKQSAYYKEKVKPYKKKKHITTLGGMEVTTEDIRNYKGKIAPNEAFQHANEANYKPASIRDTWRDAEDTTHCPQCDTRLVWDDIERTLVCPYCMGKKHKGRKEIYGGFDYYDKDQ